MNSIRKGPIEGATPSETNKQAGNERIITRNINLLRLPEITESKNLIISRDFVFKVVNQLTARQFRNISAF